MNDNRTNLEYERDECGGMARFLGAFLIPLVLIGLLASAPAAAGYLDGEVDACLQAETTLGIHGAVEACWRARQEQAIVALDAWRIIRPDVVAACEDEDAMRAMICVWDAGPVSF